VPGGEGRLVSDLDMDLDRRIAFGGGDEKWDTCIICIGECRESVFC
jgi:hypothetical protein